MKDNHILLITSRKKKKKKKEWFLIKCFLHIDNVFNQPQTDEHNMTLVNILKLNKAGLNSEFSFL